MCSFFFDLARCQTTRSYLTQVKTILLRNLPTLLGLLSVWNASCMGYEAGLSGFLFFLGEGFLLQAFHFCFILFAVSLGKSGTHLVEAC